MKLYTIYDEKAETYNTPFTALNDAIAKRIFADASNDNQTSIYHHPEDFTLYGLGTFDETTGEIIPLDKKLYLLKATAFNPEITD